MTRLLCSLSTAALVASLVGCGATASTQFSDACDRLADAYVALIGGSIEYDGLMDEANEKIDAALSGTDDFEHAESVQYAMSGLPQTIAEMNELDGEHQMMTNIQFGAIQAECDEARGLS